MSNSSRFINAAQGSKLSVIYTDTSGKHFRYYGGTRAWRNNNPGNLRPKRKRGERWIEQIGVVDNFAIFPDPQVGHDTLLYALRTVYRNCSLDKMISIFAPSTENKTKKYGNFLRDRTGVTDDRKVQDFTPTEFEKLWKAIEKYENSTEGNIVEVYQVLEVRADKHGTICEYYIDPDGWISKKNCIQLAKQRKVELEVCNKQTGDTYLRSYPNGTFQKNLSDLVKNFNNKE